MTRVDVFAAVEATESRRDIIPVESVGLAIFFVSDFCSVTFF